MPDLECEPEPLEPAAPLVLERQSLQLQVQDLRSDLGGPAKLSGLGPSDAQIDVERWGKIALDVLEGVGVLVGRLDLFFIDTDEMANLNRDHMGKEGPTDVLSFPLDQPPKELDNQDPSDVGVEPENGQAQNLVPVHLGDIVISPFVAESQAGGHTGSFESELALLTIHGVLHIVGHDHAEAEETLVMQSLERHFLAELGIVHPVAL